MAKMSVKKDDLVEVISGKDKGKKAQKPTAANQQGGFVEKEAKIDASNVMLVCPKCGKATRVGHKQGEIDGHKTAIRVCKKCGAEF